MMYRMLLVEDKQTSRVIKQTHDVRVWQVIVGGIIAIIPITTDGLAVICNRIPRLTINLHNGVIRCPIAETNEHPEKVYQNIYGKFLWVRYRNSNLIDLSEEDVFLIKGELMKWATAGERGEDGVIPLLPKAAGDKLLPTVPTIITAG